MKRVWLCSIVAFGFTVLLGPSMKSEMTTVYFACIFNALMHITQEDKR